MLLYVVPVSSLIGELPLHPSLSLRLLRRLLHFPLFLHQRRLIKRFPFGFELLVQVEKFSRTTQLLRIPSQHEFEIIDFDLGAARIGRAKGGFMARLDDVARRME